MDGDAGFGDDSGRTSEGNDSADISESIGMVQEMSSFLYSNIFWIKLVAYFNIIAGIIGCLTIIGAVVSWLPIWTGFVLLKSCRKCKSSLLTGSSDDFKLSLKLLGKFFKINAIIIILQVAFYAVYFIITVVPLICMNV